MKKRLVGVIVAFITLGPLVVGCKIKPAEITNSALGALFNALAIEVGKDLAGTSSDTM